MAGIAGSCRTLAIRPGSKLYRNAAQACGSFTGLQLVLPVAVGRRHEDSPLAN